MTGCGESPSVDLAFRCFEPICMKYAAHNVNSTQMLYITHSQYRIIYIIFIHIHMHILRKVPISTYSNPLANHFDSPCIRP